MPVPGLRELEGLTTLTAGFDARGNTFKGGQSLPLSKEGLCAQLAASFDPQQTVSTEPKPP